MIASVIAFFLASVAAADPLAEAQTRSAAFAAMTSKDRTAARDRAVRAVCDLELVPPELDTHPDPAKFGFDKLSFAMNGGLAMTKGGRLWAVWVAGGDSVKGFTVGSWSDDGGTTWQDTRFRVGSDEPAFYVGWTGLYVSHLIPEIWAAPDGTLRLYIYRCVGQFNQRGVTYEYVCRNPDAPEPVWEAPRLIALGSINNKPTALKDGTWLLPNTAEDVVWVKTEVFPEMYDRFGCGILASTDGGKTWQERGRVRPVGERHCTEHSIVERRDGTLHLLMRTGLGPMESVSSDQGRTWSVPVPSPGIRQHRSRMSYIRLASERMLLVKNGTKVDALSVRCGAPKVFRDRAELSAFISEDEGRTWKGGLVLDMRDQVAYPDAFQAADGSVYVSYEHGRESKKDEILFARFREEDVLAGKAVSSDVVFRGVIFAAGPAKAVAAPKPPAEAVALAKASLAEASAPILPGGGKYFWNTHSIAYIHPPAFDFTNVANAVSYRFEARFRSGDTWDSLPLAKTFTASVPTAPLTPIWKELPRQGVVVVTCHGLDAAGRLCGEAGPGRTFWKQAPFDPTRLPPRTRSYAEAARMTYDYLFALPALEKLVKTGTPDFSYDLNCYASKMNAAIAEAALDYIRLVPAARDRMIALARAACDYLLKVTIPAGAPLAGLTPTYVSGGGTRASKLYKGQNMLVYPASAGSAFVDLFAATGEKKYLAAAERIADAYLRLQGADGTWYLKLWEKDGKCVDPNRLLPNTVIAFLEKIYAQTGKEAYRQAADRAFAYIDRGPLVTWNWEGQFEDIAATARYVNLTKHPPLSVAAYLLRRFPNDKSRLAQARELLRFSEDQFVVWERPCWADGTTTFAPAHSLYTPRKWTALPTALEQYDWYVPTDSSVAKLINSYLALYRAEGNALDLAKAKALGDAYTRVQKANGRIPTQWMPGEYENPNRDWVNCMFASAAALTNLAKAVGEFE